MEKNLNSSKEAVIKLIEETRKTLQKQVELRKRQFVRQATRFPLNLLKEIAILRSQLDALNEIEVEVYDGNLGDLL